MTPAQIEGFIDRICCPSVLDRVAPDLARREQTADAIYEALYLCWCHSVSSFKSLNIAH